MPELRQNMQREWRMWNKIKQIWHTDCAYCMRWRYIILYGVVCMLLYLWLMT
jgi:hypothetical protein